MVKLGEDYTKLMG